MKFLFFVSITLLFSTQLNAKEKAASSSKEFDTPSCYQNIPVSCSFDDMTLSLCNSIGKEKFALDNKTHISGGNIFTSGNKTCTVKHVPKTDPAKYSVTIE